MSHTTSFRPRSLSSGSSRSVTLEFLLVIAWIVVFALWMTQRHLRLPVMRRDTSIDGLGAVLLVTGVATLILGLSWSPGQYGWTSFQTLGMLAFSGASLVALLVWEPRSTNPILPVHLFRNHTVQTMVPMVTLISAAMTTVSSFMPLFLQVATGASATRSGLMMVPQSFSISATATLSATAFHSCKPPRPCRSTKAISSTAK